MKNKPIYNVSIILSDWGVYRTWLEKYYYSKEKAERVRGKFERIKEIYLKYYINKREYTDYNENFSLWIHYHERVEFINSDVSIVEITVE